MLKWIARNGSGSYGLLFVHDDEDLIDNHSYGRGNVDHSNVFRVHRIANGQLSEMSDPFFGPIVPNLNPSELAYAAHDFHEWPNQRFNPTRAAVRVWYIMSPVGTRGLTWALGGGEICRKK